MVGRRLCLIPWKFRKHAVEIGQTLLALIYGRLWESAYGSMKDVPVWFLVVLHRNREFSHHLEVGPFPYDFVFSAILDTFLRDDEELGSSGGVVELFESKLVNFTRVIFQFQDDGAYPLGINDLPNSIDFCTVLFY